MNLHEYRTTFIVGTLVLTLVAASPTLGLVLHLPGGEAFSELWILGPGHMAEDYPFSVGSGENYMVYLGVGNHLGYSAYYTVYVKFRNETEPLPNSTSGTPSSLEPLFEDEFFVADGETWETPLNFSFSNVQQFESTTLVKTLMVNGISFDVDKPALWDSNNMGYFYQFFIEIWIYNSTAEGLQYDSRFVGLWLNMTST